MNNSLKNAAIGIPIGLLIAGGITTVAYFGDQIVSGQEAPLQDVTGYLDSTNLGFIEVHLYEINTPDGPVECFVTESRVTPADGNISCNWEEAP